MNKTASVSALRFLSLALVVVFAAAAYTELTFPISPESQRYQADYPDAIRNGLSSLYLYSKIAWVIGSLSGILGVALIMLSKRHAFTPLALSAPLVALGSYLQAPQFNYPSVEPTLALFLWCATSAIWAAVLVLAWLREA